METRSTAFRLLKSNYCWLIAFNLLVALACFHFPQRIQGTGLDPSWVGVLEYAHENGLQFGSDVIFTYGPWGLLSVGLYVPGVAVARIFFEIIIGCGIATGLSLLVWRLKPVWRIAVLAYFCCIASPNHVGGAVTFLDVGLFAWGWLCFFETGRRFWWFASVLLMLAVTGALVKFTFLLAGLFTVMWLAADRVLRKQYLEALALLTGFVGLFLIGWLVMGQRLNGIFPFLYRSADVASGYNDAMGVSGSADETCFLLMCCSSFFALTIRFLNASRERAQEWGGHRVIVGTWLAGLMFQEWKYGAVRSDLGHFEMVFAFIMVFAFFSEAFPDARRRVVNASRGAIVMCMICSVIILQRHDHTFFLTSSLGRAGHNLLQTIQVLARPTAYVREMDQKSRLGKAKAQMPQVRALVGHQPVDVFGNNQNYALFNDLNFHPRPCIQSYTAYTRKLMELDEAFYHSDKAAEYILFNLQGIDSRFSPLEDAWVLRDLMVNYTLISTNEYPVLHRKGTTNGSLTLLKEGTIRSEEKIELGSHPNAKLWLEIEIQPTWFGRLRGLFYKPQQTRLDIWGEAAPNVKMSFNAPARMLSAGFIASPLLFGTEDAIRVFQGEKGQRATAMSIYVPKRFLKSWKPEIRFRLYRIQE